MIVSSTWWPPADERALLGRFYLAESASEVLNVIYPFRFIYLFMVMGRPEWAVIPMMVEMATVLLMEIPTGVLADRWGRKRSVIAGGLFCALGWGLVPWAVTAPGQQQLLAVSVCFLCSGLGQTLVSGAEQAWVVDNLTTAGRTDLIDRYFARLRSFASLGGVVAGALALLLLLGGEVSRAKLDALWLLAASGLLLAAMLAATIRERRPPDQAAADQPAADGLRASLEGFRLIGRSRALLTLMLAFMFACFSGSIVDEAFDIALVTRGLDARALAPLGMLDDLIGMFAPLAGVVLARRFGATRLLALFLLLPAIAVMVFFVGPGLWTVIALALLLTFFDAVWDPVAEAHLHSWIPSAQRATIGSIVNQASGVAMVAGIGAFALLLGERSHELRAATPDLLEVFAGGETTHVQVPQSLFGLPLTDLAIVLFVVAGLAAIPLLLLSAHRHEKEATQ